MASSSSDSNEINFVGISSEGSDTESNTRVSDNDEGVEEGLDEEDCVAVEGFVISDIKSFITTPKLEGYHKKINFDLCVGLRAPKQGDDPTIPKVGETVFHVAFFKHGLCLLLLSVFREIFHK